MHIKAGIFVSCFYLLIVNYGEQSHRDRAWFRKKDAMIGLTKYFVLCRRSERLFRIAIVHCCMSEYIPEEQLDITSDRERCICNLIY